MMTGRHFVGMLFFSPLHRYNMYCICGVQRLIQGAPGISMVCASKLSPPLLLSYLLQNGKINHFLWWYLLMLIDLSALYC